MAINVGLDFTNSNGQMATGGANNATAAAEAAGIPSFPASSGDPVSSGVSSPTGFLDKLKGAAGALAGGIGGAVSGLFDSSAARLDLAGLSDMVGGSRKAKDSVTWLDSGGNAQSGGANGQDWRVRVSVAEGSSLLYRLNTNNFLSPLMNTNGVIFPILPQIQMTHTAKYSSQTLTHSNYAMQFYEGSEVGSIQINGEFPVQNIEEGQYLLAAIQFFRAATKMFTGGNALAGTPPPMLFLDGFGAFYFPHIPCVLTQFMHTMPEDKDYIEIPGNPGYKPSTRLPTQSTIQIVLQPIYSRKAVTTFDLDQFANGDMLSGGFV